MTLFRKLSWLFKRRRKKDDLAAELAFHLEEEAEERAYGAMSYRVARRTSEIGIRMALGARRGRVLWMVMREILALSLAGLAIGAPAALKASKAVQSFLFGIEPNDPLTLAAARAALLAAAVLAGYFPARRAAGVDPLTALRHE